MYVFNAVVSFQYKGLSMRLDVQYAKVRISIGYKVSKPNNFKTLDNG
jgi:hypothetical protein